MLSFDFGLDGSRPSDQDPRAEGSSGRLGLSRLGSAWRRRGLGEAAAWLRGAGGSGRRVTATRSGESLEEVKVGAPGLGSRRGSAVEFAHVTGKPPATSVGGVRG